jgi:hypothetical protein
VISFRFHLVSLTAVFLALALGIAMGATVVDRATVDLLQKRLDTVKTDSERTESQNEQLRAQLGRWGQFTDQAGNRLVAARLSGVAVVPVFVEGSDRGSFDALRQALFDAGATVPATIVLTAKLALRSNDDIDALRTLTDAAEAKAPDLRRIVASEVTAALSAPADAGPLGNLVDKGFARLEAATGPSPAATAVAVDGARFVVYSDAKAAAPNAELAQPLVDELAQRFPARVLAVEPGRDAKGSDPAVRAVFVGPIRAENNISVSTVDDIEQYAGRIAAVLALQAMGAGKVGHFGVGPGAARLLPDTPG